MHHGADTAKRMALPSWSDSNPANDQTSLAPKYDELASLYTSNPEFDKQVTIAKVDATANDVPDEIQGFPTIKLFPAGGKSEPILYSGSRTIEDLATFVKENGKYKVDAYEGKNETETTEEGEAEELGKQAPAATEGVKEKVKSVVKEAVESAKSVVKDSDDEVHDEL